MHEMLESAHFGASCSRFFKTFKNFKAFQISEAENAGALGSKLYSMSTRPQSGADCSRLNKMKEKKIQETEKSKKESD